MPRQIDRSERVADALPCRYLSVCRSRVTTAVGPILSRQLNSCVVAGRWEGRHLSNETDAVDAQIEAYRARDVAGFLSHYADDASVVMFDGTVLFGTKEAMREAYGKLFADSPDLHVAIAGRVTAGEFVVDEEHLSGFHFGDMPTDMVSVAVYRVVNGKIAKLMLLS
jgi:hypothetical protein